MRHLWKTALVLAIVLPAPSASAENSETIVVTATRTARTVDETIAPVSVITREDIEKSTARDLGELLSGLPGVDISRSGGYGKNTSLFLRGTNSNQVLTLVDGVKLYSATVGATAFQFIPLEQIERIEVVRGPRSSLYGSEAIGGVVQIFTRRGSEENRWGASAGYGTYNTGEVSASGSGTAGQLQYSLVANAFQTDGFNALNDAQPDDDGYDNLSLSASARSDFERGGVLDLTFLRAEGTTDFDNPFDPPSVFHDSDFVQQVAAARWDISPTDVWSSTVRVGQSRDESETFSDGVSDSEFDTKRNEISWQNDFQIRDSHILTAGIDYSDDQVESSTEFEEDSRDNTALFGEWQGDWEARRAVLGVRYDDNEQFGSHYSGNVDFAQDIGRNLTLSLGAGSAFKAPTFNDLYFPDFGNPDLDAERSASIEAGISGLVSGGRWAARVFRTEIEDLITFDSVTFVPENIDEARINGLELELQAIVSQWSVTGALTLLDPTDEETGNVLPRRARETLFVSGARQWDRWRTGLSVLAQGKRYDDKANTVELDSYVVLNADLEYRLPANWTFKIDLRNLLDEDYQTVDGYNEPGRTIFAKVRYAGGR